MNAIEVIYCKEIVRIAKGDRIRNEVMRIEFRQEPISHTAGNNQLS